MNNQELANALFELRVVSFNPAHEYAYNTVAGGKNMNAEQIVRDWRIAGALIDLCVKHEFKFVFRIGPTINEKFGCAIRAAHMSVANVEIEHESLPRAICEACVKALS